MPTSAVTVDAEFPTFPVDEKEVFTIIRFNIAIMY